MENIDTELSAYPDNIFENLENEQPFEMLGEDPEYDGNRYTKVRILSAQNLPTSPNAVLEKKQESKFDLQLRKLKTTIGKKSGGDFAVEQDTLLIHVHGGGFIATTSQSHQAYARVWANNLPNAVVFSIDYRMAPKNKFPDAIDDCWQAYVWIIKNA